MTPLYIAVLVATAALALTRRRVYVLCFFYFVYGVLKVMALDESVALSWAELVLFRALYPILLLSAMVRLFQDRQLPSAIQKWPMLAYGAFVCIFVSSAIYSKSAHAFAAQDPANIWVQLTIVLLFPLAASQIQRPKDLQIFAYTTVLVSLALSAWIVRNTLALNFEAFRGGIDVNQNFVSLFVLAGALPLIHMIATSQRKMAKVTGLLALLFILIAAALLASRGIILAFTAAALCMAQNRKIRAAIVVSGVAAILVLSITHAGSQFMERFSDTDVGSLNGRTLVWKHSLREMGDSPSHLLLGYGYNSARVLLPPVLPDDLWNYHNDLLNWFMDAGILGLSLFAAFLYAMSRRIRNTTHALKPLIIAWLAFLIFSGLSGVISEMHIYWLICGAICGACSLEPENRPAQPRELASTASFA